MKHLIDIKDLSKKEIFELIEVAQDIMKNEEKYAEKCKRKKLATLFYEPSTRTRLSFEAAMLELGGNVLGFSSSSSSSVAKGESVADTAKVISGYADIIVMRHPKEGAPLVASMKSDVPVINAGDGGHNHPTQTLTDLLTIQCEKHRLTNLTIGVCGDLKFGRTVHSLITAMSKYENIKFVLISPKELEIPDYIRKDVLEKNNIEYFKLTGQTKVEDRMDLVNKFNNNENIKVFLISLKAGGTGLNLIGADMVIHYDPWWNLSAENQATDRTYRIGQKRNVQVYKLITKNSIEEKIYNLQERKAELANNMLNTKTKFISQLSKDEIMNLFE